MRLEHLNHLVELLIRPIRAQLADAPLNSGLVTALLALLFGGDCHGEFYAYKIPCVMDSI